ncbi:MAG TPA: CBS domain-containing protein [Nitrososphaeraceae archaeon]
MGSNIAFESTSVSNIMITNVKTAKKTQSIQEVCTMMSENKIGSIVILNNSNIKDNIPIGIVTKGDVVRAVSEQAKLFSIDSYVREIMSSPLITINSNSSIRNAIETMQQEDIRRLPIVDSETKILGIITNNDLFRAILKNQILVSSIVHDQTLVGYNQSLYGKLTDCWLSNIYSDRHDEFLMTGKYCTDYESDRFL